MRTQAAVKKYDKVVKENKKLYNQMMELRGNIRVYCRLRPLSASEQGTQCCHAGKEGEVIVTDPTKDNQKKVFQFDEVYNTDSTQAKVFEDTRPLITSVLDGFNVCIFAYGQTGSGKTYTMAGPDSDPGVNTRALKELFRISEERKVDYDISITVSNLEIYQEEVYDLLAEVPKGKKTDREKMQIRQAKTGTSMEVPGLIEVTCSTIEDVNEVIKRGNNNRSSATTDMNEHSSRSHSLLRISVRCMNNVSFITTVGKLTLVDLAGSERVGKSGVVGEGLKEAASINKSLAALGNCISSLTSDLSHVPYRDSKLTHLLQDSLGGNSKTLMFVQISPNSYNVGESICSLNFAIRVRSVKLGFATAQTVAPDVQAMQAKLAELQAKVEASKT